MDPRILPCRLHPILQRLSMAVNIIHIYRSGFDKVNSSNIAPVKPFTPDHNHPATPNPVHVRTLSWMPSFVGCSLQTTSNHGTESAVRCQNLPTPRACPCSQHASLRSVILFRSLATCLFGISLRCLILSACQTFAVGLISDSSVATNIIRFLPGRRMRGRDL
jgi:hypothetical protein